jgi:hypothetical protein
MSRAVKWTTDRLGSGLRTVKDRLPSVRYRLLPNISPNLSDFCSERTSLFALSQRNQFRRFL